jgi:streptogramin lyase
MKRVLVVLALVPLVAATAIAGVVSDPSTHRPCFTEFTKGVSGNPTHLILGRDGDLYATEEPNKLIVRFDPETHVTREYKLNVPPHDLTTGPDGRIWFLSATANVDKKTGKVTGEYLGALTPSTGKVEYITGITPGAEPHMLRWNSDGRLYITEQAAGRLAIYDPKTKKVTEGRFGLPAGNYVHNVAVLPNGDIWVVLQEGDQLARFNFKSQRFDRFVDIPIANSGPRDITYVPSRNALFATLFAANQIAEYDLDTGKLTLHDTHVAPTSYDVALLGRKPKLTFLRADAQQEAVWVATLAGGELLRFDLKTNEIERVGCGIQVPGGPLGIANDRKGRLWVAEPFPGRIARVDR